MVVKKVPQRMCIVCKQMFDKKDLVRILKTEDDIVIDITGKKNGRGAYVCKNGCIACGKCEKVCPSGAIVVKDNLATIDYEKCTNCGACREACPVKCIHEGNFICGAHFE